MFIYHEEVYNKNLQNNNDYNDLKNKTISGTNLNVGGFGKMPKRNIKSNTIFKATGSSNMNNNHFKNSTMQKKNFPGMIKNPQFIGGKNAIPKYGQTNYNVKTEGKETNW